MRGHVAPRKSLPCGKRSGVADRLDFADIEALTYEFV
jgi:hypothetical protein